MADVILPTIHHGGTAKAELVAELCTAIADLETAKASLALTGPNQRDYPNVSGYLDALRWGKADNQHRLRLAMLDHLIASLRSQCEAIDQMEP